MLLNWWAKQTCTRSHVQNMFKTCSMKCRAGHPDILRTVDYTSLECCIHRFFKRLGLHDSLTHPVYLRCLTAKHLSCCLFLSHCPGVNWLTALRKTWKKILLGICGCSQIQFSFGNPLTWNGLHWVRKSLQYNFTKPFTLIYLLFLGPNYIGNVKRI